jgi:hypothetical protein
MDLLFPSKLSTGLNKYSSVNELMDNLTFHCPYPNLKLTTKSQGNTPL